MTVDDSQYKNNRRKYHAEPCADKIDNPAVRKGRKEIVRSVHGSWKDSGPR